MTGTQEQWWKTEKDKGSILLNYSGGRNDPLNTTSLCYLDLIFNVSVLMPSLILIEGFIVNYATVFFTNL